MDGGVDGGLQQCGGSRVMKSRRILIPQSKREREGEG